MILPASLLLSLGFPHAPLPIVSVQRGFTSHREFRYKSLRIAARSLAFAVLMSSGGSRAIAAPVPLALVPAPSAPLFASDGLSETLAAYAHRAGQLRHLALAQGQVTYAEVVASAYPAGVITDELLAIKAAWRESLGSRGPFTLLADYHLANTAATVTMLNATADPVLRSTLVAQYESIQHRIGLASAASDFCIYHEAGHALQRAALRARGCGEAPWAASHATHDRFDALLQSGRADATSVARLRYLASQDEFEVRLQDLNRFFALCVEGRPILSARDSLRALAALGVPVSFDDAHAAFSTGGESLSESDHQAIMGSIPAVPASSVDLFEDAQELRLLRRLALRTDPDGWHWILAKIIFEAPGHM